MQCLLLKTLSKTQEVKYKNLLLPNDGITYIIVFVLLRQASVAQLVEQRIRNA